VTRSTTVFDNFFRGTIGMASLWALSGPHPSFQPVLIMGQCVSLPGDSPDLCMVPLEILERPSVSAT